MKLTEKQIEGAVNRFLAWQLPKGFNPDGGISFNGKHDPVGTNLFTATQAKEMIEYIFQDEPVMPLSQKVEYYKCDECGDFIAINEKTPYWVIQQIKVFHLHRTYKVPCRQQYTETTKEEFWKLSLNQNNE